MEQYEKLLRLRREEAEATASLLRDKQVEENKRSFWLNVVVGAVTNLLTAIICIWLENRVGLFRRWFVIRKQDKD